MTKKVESISKKRVEEVLNIYIGAFFNGIQDILTSKETSNDINLDIAMKINSKCHQICVDIKKRLLEE